MKKITAICISIIMIIAFIMPTGIFAETNSVQNPVEPLGAPSRQNETDWYILKQKIESSGANGNPVIIKVDSDITADLTKDTGRTIEINANQNIVLKGNKNINGIGFSSIKVHKGGSLTIDGPSIKNAQTIVEGKLNLNSGKISDTKLEGPTIFVNSGEFTMNGGEISGNEAIESQAPQPSEINKIDDFYQYSPITVYSGTAIVNAGKISENRSFLNGGAIGAWGTDSSKANVYIAGGDITGNQAEHSRKYAWGGSIYTLNSNFEMTGGSISKNIAEKGGGIAAHKSNMTFIGGNIIDNTNNGDYQGEGGGILAYDTNITIKNINISNNTANGDGGGVCIKGIKEKPNINIESGVFKGNSATKDSGASGGALLIRRCTYKINGGTFTDNFAKYMGGAICFTDKSEGLINAGLFTKNSATGKWGGGAIMNDNTCKLVIKRGLIKNNKIEKSYMIGAGNHPASRQGGGIFNCPTGNTEIYITNGLALYDNAAPNLEGYPANNGAGDDFINITTYSFDKPASKISQVKLASRMLGGGYRLWYQDGSFYNHWINWPKFQQTPRYDPNNPGKPLPYNIEIKEKKGAQLAYKSVPSDESKALAEKVATTIISDNVAYGSELSGGGKCGGGIANNGKLIFGEHNPYKIKIVKSWTGDNIKKRPKEIVLKMYVGDHYIEDVKLTAKENWTKTIEDFPDPDTLVDNKTGKVIPINFQEKNSGKYVFSLVSRVRDEKAKLYTINLDNSIKKPVSKSVKFIKKWNDNDNKDGIRPLEIKVGLFANGKQTGKELIVSEKENWKGEFNNLPLYENGKLIQYEIKEIGEIKGYVSEVKGNDKDGFTIINTRIPVEKPKIPGGPKTGDGSRISIYAISLGLALILIIAAVVIRKKR